MHDKKREYLQFTPTVKPINISSAFINKTGGTKNTVKLECTGVTYKTGEIYRVKESFELSDTRFKANVPTKEQTEVGDLFELYAEPTPKKKLYQLVKMNTKFPYILQVRPNDFKRYFEPVESEEN